MPGVREKDYHWRAAPGLGADRQAGGEGAGRKPFQSLAPLPEVIAAATGLSAASRRTAEQYHALLAQLGPEFTILRETPVEDIERAAGPCVAEGVRRVREGRVERIAGYDGEYGKIALLTPEEREAMTGQLSLFRAPAERRTRKKAALPEKRAAAQAKQGGREEIAAQTEELNEEQLAAATTGAETVAVIAGPGTGKTKTLVARIAHLIGERGMKPSQITAVTFTNQAAAEVRERLGARLGGKKNLRGMTIGTFHAICLGLLDKKPLLGENESLFLIRDILREQGSRASPGETLRRISRAQERRGAGGGGPGPGGLPGVLRQVQGDGGAGPGRSAARRPGTAGRQGQDVRLPFGGRISGY